MQTKPVLLILKTYYISKMVRCSRLFIEKNNQHYRTDKNSVLSWPIRDDTTAPLAYPKECKHIDYGLQYKIAIKRIFTLFFTNIVTDGA